MNISDLKRNQYQLKGALEKNGYDWWWHSFTGVHLKTGEEKSFFIEYYVVNPGLAERDPVLAQLPENQAKGKKPSYAMIKAGHWGEGAKQIHNYFGFKDFTYNPEKLHINIGESSLTETHMKGSVRVSTEEVAMHPEWMCDQGHMTWDLKIDKQIAYHVGYGAGAPMRWLNAFDMYWHAEGAKSAYAGYVELDGERYEVYPEKSFGYADKNWGKDFTSPWVWLSSCDLVSKTTGERLNNSVLEIGGGRPKVFNKALDRKLLVSFFHEGIAYDYNFSKFWKYSDVRFDFFELKDQVIWQVTAEDQKSRIHVHISCDKKDMLLINYEAPDGKKRHNKLWNGGTGRGELELYHMKDGKFEKVDTFMIGHTGCEYGTYNENNSDLKTNKLT